MKRVYKYPVNRNAKKFSLILPMNFKFLRVQLQNETAFFWAEVILDGLTVEYKFELFGTGQDIPDTAKHLGTYDDGPFVFHLFQMS